MRGGQAYCRPPFSNLKLHIMDTKNKIRGHDLLSGYNYFIPKPMELFALTLFFIGGVLISNAIAAGILLMLPGVPMDAVSLVCYPVMFIPPMIYAGNRSLMNAAFDTGYKMNSCNFGKTGMWACAASVIIATVALAYLMDMVNVLMPPVPERLERAFDTMVGGNIVLNFISICILAPFFEEWLCRGMVLRGLLNFRRKPAAYSTTDKADMETAGNFRPEVPASPEDAASAEECRGIGPAWAIMLSAAFFALIHMNPWQAVPAFALGCLFGYVYWRTGSLWLTMLMHFTNNMSALLMSKVDSLKDAKTWFDVMPVWEYAIFAAMAIAFLWLFFWQFQRIPLASSQGGCDAIR